MMCTVPYKKYKGYLFTNIRDGGIFELRATYDPSAALTAVSGNPYTLWLYFYTGGVFLDGHVLIKHIELSTASTGEKIYSRQEEIKLAFNRMQGSYKNSDSHISHTISDLQLDFEPYRLKLEFQFIAEKNHSDIRSVDEIFQTAYEERWFNPVWSAWMGI
jgi:hypothetical protein